MARTELVEYCKSKEIVLEAWAPLVRGERFDHPVVVELAKKYGKSPAQVLIRYGLDRVRDTLLLSNADEANQITLLRVSSSFRNRLDKSESSTTQTFSILFSRRKT
jgi:diketogulonate reductase-like aldo/keto reductase